MLSDPRLVCVPADNTPDGFWKRLAAKLGNLLSQDVEYKGFEWMDEDRVRTSSSIVRRPLEVDDEQEDEESDEESGVSAHSQPFTTIHNHSLHLLTLRLLLLLADHSWEVERPLDKREVKGNHSQVHSSTIQTILAPGLPRGNRPRTSHRISSTSMKPSGREARRAFRAAREHVLCGEERARV